MARPVKCRRIAFIPGVTFFKPEGIPLKCLREIRLSLEEAEALRLKDVAGLEQEEGAQRMNVSRPTFQRVLASARHKMADALLNGKAIRIDGGHFEMSPVRFRCSNGHEWEMPFESTADTARQLCPVCGTPSVAMLSPAGIRCPLDRQAPCCRRCLGVARAANELVSTKAD